MKIIILLVCAFAFVASLEADENHHHAMWGVIGPGDKLIRRDVLVDDPAYTGKSKTTYSFPSSDHTALFPYSRITAVKAIDQYDDGNGGTVTLLAGGPQSLDVSLRVKSQLFRGYHFVIEIWGQ